MSRLFQCPVEVRGYELDSFGHVNHAVYVSYLEHARWRVLKEIGVTLDMLQQWKVWPVIAKLDIQYKKPTFLGDLLEVDTKVLENTKTSMTFQQTIRRGPDIVLQAEVYAVMVNDKGRPTGIPEALKALWASAMAGDGMP